MPHVLVDFGQRKQEDVRIACLRVLFRNRTVEAVLRCHGEGETVYVGFALLLVALRGVTVQAVGDVAEVRLPVAIVGKTRGKFAHIVTLELQVVLPISIQ